MDEWTWQYPELHPDQPRVTRLNHTEEILSPRVEVEDWEWACEQSTQPHGAKSAVVHKVHKAQQSLGLFTWAILTCDVALRHDFDRNNPAEIVLRCDQAR